MSDTEANRIDECMQKPEFASLFKEYIDDISNPGNMEEYDQYLRQLEDEGEIPETEEVIRPEKGFCVKIPTVDTGAKIFVNLCGTDRVPEPSQGDAKAGTNYDTTGSKVLLAKSRPSLTHKQSSAGREAASARISLR
jgi:hypothetical protein